jgi:hypothetical protein
VRRIIATRAWAFGMNVIDVDPHDYPFTPFIKKYVKPDGRSPSGSGRVLSVSLCKGRSADLFQGGITQDPAY